MYVKLSAIKGAASFNNLGPILSLPVGLVRSIFLRYFSIFSQDISGIVKEVITKLLQFIKIRNLNWLFGFLCYIYKTIIGLISNVF